MHHNRHGLRIALLAGASVITLAAAAPSAGAADLSKPVPTKAPPAPAPKPTWTWWIEGGAMNPGSNSFGLGSALSNIKPRWGGEGAAGFDWQPGWGPWHLSGQFRYGSAQKTKSFRGSTTLVGPGGNTTVVFTTSNNEKIRDDHWVVDFAVGRDFGLGNGNAQWKVGLRVADLRARLTASGGVSVNPATTGVFSIQQDSTFVGAGPRLGVEGSTPLGGGCSGEAFCLPFFIRNLNVGARSYFPPPLWGRVGRGVAK